MTVLDQSGKSLWSGIGEYRNAGTLLRSCLFGTAPNWELIARSGVAIPAWVEGAVRPLLQCTVEHE